MCHVCVVPANKYALLRYRVIDRCIKHPTRPYPSKEDLRFACEEALYGSSGERLSTSTIEKDLWAMRNEGDLGYYAPIVYNSTHRGYCYEDPSYSINDVNLSDSDLKSLRFAALTLVQFQDVPVFRQYQEAIGKIFDRVSFVEGAGGGSVSPFVQFEQAPKTLGTEYFEPLLEALEHSLEIEIRYRKFSTGTAQWVADDALPSRTIAPYLLKEYRNRWYLIAKEQSNNSSSNNDGYSSIKTFAFDRIAALSLTATKFKRDVKFDSARYFNHSIGITAGLEEAATVTFEAAPLLAHYLKTQPLHHSQKPAAPIKGSGALGWQSFQIQVHLTYELQQIFLGFGADVRVLSPETFALQIRSALETAASHYS